MSQYPVLYAGQRFTAALASSMLWLDAAKTASTDRTSTTTISADPELQLAVEANAEYEFQFMLRVGGALAGGIDIQMTTPTGATGSYSCTRLIAGAADNGTRTSIRSVYNTEVTYSTPSTSAHQVLIGSGRLITSSTAGTFSADWAQNVSNATASTMHQDSFIKLRRIA